MVCRELFKKIDELNEKYVDIWEKVCSIESPSSVKEGVDKVGTYFADLATKQGWKVERFQHHISGDVVCITMNPDANNPPICISGHMDTVHPVGMFGYPPVKLDEEYIYGPGVSDCKGGIVAGFLAMEALAELGFSKRPVRMLLQSDEEVGSNPSNKATIKYICERARDSVAFLNLEPHLEGKAVIQRKGIVSYRFDITGVEAHSSKCATEGANAIIDAAHKMLELDKIKDSTGLTCNCALINGGTVLNTVPGHCSFSVNVRYATAEQYEWISNFVKDLAATEHVKGCTATVTQIGMRVSMERTARNLALLEKMNTIFEENSLPRLAPTATGGGSDAADMTVFGVPCVDSLGVEGAGHHSIREKSRIASLAESAKRLAAVIYCF